MPSRLERATALDTENYDSSIPSYRRAVRRIRAASVSRRRLASARWGVDGGIPRRVARHARPLNGEAAPVARPGRHRRQPRRLPRRLPPGQRCRVDHRRRHRRRRRRLGAELPVPRDPPAGSVRRSCLRLHDELHDRRRHASRRVGMVGVPAQDHPCRSRQATADRADSTVQAHAPTCLQERNRS